jgi:hypothetical protein
MLRAQRMKRITLSAGLCLAACLVPLACSAELPSFDDFFRQVSECRLDLSRYRPLVGATQDGVLIALPSAGAVRGFLIDSFFLAPAAMDGVEQYGLLINGPLEAVGKAFPEFSTRHTINGHLRRLARLSEQSSERGASRKTLLVCTSGTPV